MKIIYEDGNEPFKSENNTSGEFGGEPGVFGEQTNNVPQMTPEQVTAILQQILANQQAQTQGAKQQQFAPLEEEPEEKRDAPELNPGTRVLFQSEDFDGIEPKDASDKADDFNFKSKSFKDTFTEEKVQEEFSPVKTIEVSFKVDDVEIEDEELPFGVSEESLPPKREVAPSTLPFGNIEVEEIEEETEGQDKKKIWNIVRIAVLAVAILAIVISSVVLIKEYRLHKENQRLESEVSNLIIDEDTDIPGVVSNNIVMTEEQQWDQIRAQYPTVAFPTGMQLKYAKLYATNKDFVGYLEAEGVNLSLPVVQADNDSDYLEKSFYGKTTKYGCPFVSCQNRIDELNLNTVIYGHHMNDKTIFGALDAYKSIEGFKKAPVITFNTLYKDYTWKVVAAFISNAKPSDDKGYVFNYFFNTLSSKEIYGAYLNELAQRSLYYTGVDVLPTDKLLTLSTCSHEFDNARFVVVARLVRPGETASVDTSAAIINSNPRYPQAYYSKKKISNPYADANRWVVG